MPSIYLAGPEVFHPEALALGRAKQALCRALGFEGLYPLDGEIPAGDLTPAELALAIYRANVGLIRRADLVIANLTPFRGPGADAGTVFEVGFALGLGKRVLGYRNVADSYLERVRTWNIVPLTRDPSGHVTDRDGLMVEDFGLGDNLMIDGSLIEGGIPVIEHAAEPGAVLTDLTAFAHCLKRVQALLSSE